jgi:hypothetical protein
MHYIWHYLNPTPPPPRSAFAAAGYDVRGEHSWGTCWSRPKPDLSQEARIPEEIWYRLYMIQVMMKSTSWLSLWNLRHLWHPGFISECNCLYKLPDFWWCQVSWWRLLSQFQCVTCSGIKT